MDKLKRLKEIEHLMEKNHQKATMISPFIKMARDMNDPDLRLQWQRKLGDILKENTKLHLEANNL